MTTEITGNSSRSDITSIDDTDSPYTTQGEGTIAVDTSNGAVTVTLASADVESGQPVEIYDSGNNAAANNITINTEGSETINPGGASSITLSTSGTYREIKSDGSNWFAQVNAQRDLVSTDDLTIADITDGSTDEVVGALSGNNNGAEIKTHPDEAVETSDTIIMTHTQNAGFAIVAVFGVDQSDSTQRFYDWVNFPRSEFPQTAQSFERGTPAGRSYSRSGSDLVLAMGSGTYDVTATASFATHTI